MVKIPLDSVATMTYVVTRIASGRKYSCSVSRHNGMNKRQCMSAYMRYS